MPFIRLDEDGFEPDDPDDEFGDGHYIGPFNYVPADEYAYEPHPFDPATLTHVPAVIHAALAARGATRFRVSYDGGHDEGFAHAGLIWFGGGDDADLEVAFDLASAWAGDAPLVAALRAANDRWRAEHAVRHNRPTAERADDRSPKQVIVDAFEELAQHVAGSLLGNGFGTGEFSIYGACVLDLRTNAIADDPDEEMPSDLSD